MPSVAVHFIELQKKTNDLVMGTHGRGVIIIDDISPLREINDKVLAKKVHFFETKPTVIFEEGSFSGSFGAETQFVGANPSRAAQIKYHLNRRHTFGKMTLEIQDENGKTVSKLAPGKSKGINIVNWSYRLKNPKVAKGKTFSYGGFTSPIALAGTYTVILKKGKETFSQKIEIIYDPTSNLSEEDRTFKHNTTMKMYGMTEELAYMVYELDAILLKATELRNKKIVAKLTALKETLVITTGDNYVGSAAAQLREKMTDLYSKIATSYDTPSIAELESLGIIEERFVAAKMDYAKIKKKVKFLEALKLETFEEFVK
jgi:hypothetical protein